MKVAIRIISNGHFFLWGILPLSICILLKNIHFKTLFRPFCSNTKLKAKLYVCNKSTNYY